MLFDHHCNVCSLNISASFIDNQQVDLEFDRHPVLETFCADGAEENWEDIFEEVSEEYVKDINSYAKENLIKLRVFISTPFATEYTRSIEMTRTSFIANIGGEGTPRLHMAMRQSYTRSFRFDGTLHGLQLRQRRGDRLLPWPLSYQPLQAELGQTERQSRPVGSKEERRTLNSSSSLH